MYSLANTLFFGYSPLLAWGWGQKLAKFAVFLVAKILKCTFFLTFLNGYIHPNNFKNKKTSPGALPQTPLTCEAGGRWQTLSTYPYGECWVDSKASRVKCTTSSPLTPLHLRGGSKTNRSGAGNPSRLAKQPRSGLAFTGWRRPNAGKGAGGFSLHPCHVANAGGAAPTVLARPLGVAQSGKCRRHSF